MPIYLDRHDNPDDVDARHIAEMHLIDLKLQDNFNCKGLTYWYDDHSSKGFCLFEAPNEDAINKLHNQAHGGIPTTIIEVSEREVISFLGRISDPEQMTKDTINVIDDSAFRTLLVLKLYPVNLMKKESTNYQNTLEDINSFILKNIADFNGSVVKANLENYLIAFDLVSNAFNCANILNSNLLDDFNFNRYFTFNIGAHCGDPVTKAGELFGQTILLANRMSEYVEGSLVISADLKNHFLNEKNKDTFNLRYIRFLTREEEDCLNKLVDFLDQNYQNPNLHLQNFCRDLGFSKSKLYRKVKSLTGKSVNHFIKEFRLQKALNLFKDQKNNISEMAYAIGFNSPAYFSRCFKKHYGILPSEYQ